MRFLQEKYDYSLPPALVLGARTKLCMLRSLCQKCGLQVQTRDYALEPSIENMSPFDIEDILDVYPIVKTNFVQVGVSLCIRAFR